VDKIILSGKTVAKGHDGPSMNMSQYHDRGLTTIEYKTFLPRQVWKMKNNIAVIEAEDIDHHSDWEFSTYPGGYCGKGYLKWKGTDRTRSIENLGGNDDFLYVRQGPREEWIIIRLLVQQAGTYRVNARNYHRLEDGDNDAWISMVGFRPWHQSAYDDRVRRMGDSHKDGTGFTWLDWGIREFPLNEGYNEIYISGRSVDWGLDRIAIYPSDDPTAETEALNKDNPPSKTIEYQRK
jgi:hypothetical protein